MPSVAPVDIDDHVIAAAFLGGIPFFATAGGRIHRLDDGVLGRKLLKREKESADAAVLKGRLDRQRRSALDERLEDD